MKAQIEVIEVKEEPVFSIPVELDSINSIMDEVAKITSHLDPERRYKIVVKPDLDPSCIAQEIWDRIAQRNQVNHAKLMAGLLFPRSKSKYPCYWGD